MLDWKTVESDFRCDEGSLRDICVEPTTIDDWRKIYVLLRNGKFAVDGTPHSLPATIEEVFQLRTSSAACSLMLYIGKVSFACYFGWPGGIEFDFDPREVTSQEDLDVVLGFIQQIGNVVGKVVVITPESLMQTPIISYDPIERRFQYHPITTAQ